jgi:hypothetical protein
MVNLNLHLHDSARREVLTLMEYHQAASNTQIGDSRRAERFAGRRLNAGNACAVNTGELSQLSGTTRCSAGYKVLDQLVQRVFKPSSGSVAQKEKPEPNHGVRLNRFNLPPNPKGQVIDGKGEFHNRVLRKQVRSL